MRQRQHLRLVKDHDAVGQIIRQAGTLTDEALAEQLRAVVVAVIGRKIVLFRRPLNPKNRRIELPGRGTV